MENDITESDWQHLENLLINRALTMKEDIFEYLNFSAYFFTMIDKQGLGILRSFIEETK